MRVTFLHHAMLTLIASTAVVASLEAADDPRPAPKVIEAQTQHEGHLGLSVAPLHASLGAHLPGVLDKQQGVLVVAVAPNSPAARAGIQSHDILVSYGDQKLFAVEQLIKLVRSDRPGHEVVVGFVHRGKIAEAKVTLDDRQVLTGKPRTLAPWPQWNLLQPLKPSEANLEGFEFISIRRLSQERLQLVVEFRGNDGQSRRFEFEGTRAEIHKQVGSAKDLPSHDRHDLLHHLDGAHPKPPVLELPDGSPLWITPTGEWWSPRRIDEF